MYVLAIAGGYDAAHDQRAICVRNIHILAAIGDAYAQSHNLLIEFII